MSVNSTHCSPHEKAWQKCQINFIQKNKKWKNRLILALALKQKFTKLFKRIKILYPESFNSVLLFFG